MTRIVAIHGFLGKPSDWHRLQDEIKKLAPECEFQAVDLQAAQLIKTKSPKDWSKKFNQQQKSKHVERNILVGYSLGGRLALHAAIDKPGLWDKVVLISADPGLEDFVDEQARLKRDENWADKFAKMSWSEVMREWNKQDVFTGSHEPSRHENDYNRDQLIHMIKDWSLVHHDIREEALIDLKPKLIWYAGEKDAKYAHLFQNLRDKGFIEEVHTVQNAGHRLIFDNPTEFAHQLVTDLNL